MLCSHNLAEAEALADRIIIIKRGRVLARGTGDELKRALLGPPVYELRLTGPLAPIWPARLRPRLGLRAANAGPRLAPLPRADPAALNPALVARLSAAARGVLTLAEVSRSLETVYLTLMADAEQENPHERAAS